MLAALLVAAALLAIPASAGATLTFVRNPLNPTVYVANDNGSGAKKLAAGSNAHVSPDGEAVAYLHEGPGHAQELKLAPSAGGEARTLLQGFRESFYLAFSPDSTQIAALRGPELGKRNLVLIDVASGAQTVVANGYFSGFSFSPAGDELVYGRAASESYPAEVRRLPLRDRLRQTVAADQRPPLPGPALGTDRHDRLRQADRRQAAQVRPEERALPDEPERQGGQAPHPHQRRPAADGPLPDRLVGRRQAPAGRVRGPGHQLRGRRQPQDRRPEAGRRGRGDGFVGTALSADGKTVLGFTGGFDPASTTRSRRSRTAGQEEGAGHEALTNRLEPLARRGVLEQATWRRIETLSG